MVSMFHRVLEIYVIVAGVANIILRLIHAPTISIKMIKYKYAVFLKEYYCS
jgi:hypothetical protein